MWLCPGSRHEGEGHGDFPFDLGEPRAAPSKCSLSQKQRKTNTPNLSQRCSDRFLISPGTWVRTAIWCVSPDGVLKGIKGWIECTLSNAFPGSRKEGSCLKTTGQRMTLLCVGRSSYSAEGTASGGMWSRRLWRRRGHPSSQFSAKCIIGIY